MVMVLLHIYARINTVLYFIKSLKSFMPC